MVKHLFGIWVLCVGLLFVVVFAEEDNQDVEITWSGSASIQIGQIVKGKHIGEDLTYRQWLHNELLNFTLTANIGERLRVIVSAEGKSWYSTFPQEKIFDFFHAPEKYFSFYIHQGEGIYAFGNRENPFLELGVGLFPYKYNPEVKNLGEFLFRSGTYPAYLISEFDFAFARLTGMRLHHTPFTGFHQDLLFTTETEKYPFYDFSLSYLLNFHIEKILDVGAGVCFCRLLPVDKNKTTPEHVNNAYVTAGGDTAYYTFRGTKLMGRITIDPKGFFSGAIFGEQDLKLYAEAAILGLKDYPVYYDHIWQKIPLVIGFNLPTFKLFDVLALEAEYYDLRYANSYENVYRTLLPLTDNNLFPKGDYDIEDYREDDWKWSVFVEKTIGKGFSILGQAARDHMRTQSAFALYIDREEALSKSDHWYWITKAVFRF